MSQQAIVSLRDIRKEFSGVEVLHGLTVEFYRNSIHALVGENGAGKSTLVKILSGFFPHHEYEGIIEMDGSPVRFSGIRDANQAGIGIISQELELVGTLPVYENIFLGNELTSRGILRKDEMMQKATALIHLFGLEVNPLSPVEELGIGQQQMVAIAKALTQKTRVLILDEPTAALTETEAGKLFEILKGLVAQGITIIYISHRLGEVLRLSDRITVIRDGELVITDDTSAFTEDSLIGYMVGRSIENRYPSRRVDRGTTVLRVENLSAVNHQGRTKVQNVSFEACAGEVVGIAGLIGSGRTELVSAIYGAFDGAVHGDIYLDGEKVTISSPRSAIRHGIGLVVEDRKSDGLVLCLNLVANNSLACLRELTPLGVLNREKELQRANQAVARLSIRTPSVDLLVGRLSGGNQQKVSVSKILETKPRVLILDEPTRGVDVGAKFEIYQIINQLAAQGIAVIVVSSELPEVLGISDRILVMKEGRITAQLANKDLTQEMIMHYATLEE